VCTCTLLIQPVSLIYPCPNKSGQSNKTRNEYTQLLFVVFTMQVEGQKVTSICLQSHGVSVASFACKKRQDLPCTYLAHHELESVKFVIVIYYLHVRGCFSVAR